MNIRFADKQIRFRIATEELDRLLTGRSLALEVSMPRSHRFRASVATTQLDKWQLDQDPTGIWLTVPRAAVTEFAKSLPSKEGLQHRFAVGAADELSVVLEVDLRQRS